jgi:phosphatidylglycerophosphate synthase
MVRSGIIFGLVAQSAALTVVATTAGLSVAGWLAGSGVGLFTVSALTRGLRRSGASALGPANCVTLTRAALVGGVAALVADSFVRPTPLPAMAALAAVALLLDAVDGQVARRTRTATTVGARFDMEVDAFLIFILSVFVARSVGPWVLTIGLARYVFVAAGWRVGWLRNATPRRFWCKIVAAIQGIVLTIAATNVLPRPVIEPLLAVALALLGESFGRDVWWLWRHRIRAATPVRRTGLLAVGSR